VSFDLKSTLTFVFWLNYHEESSETIAYVLLIACLPIKTAKNIVYSKDSLELCVYKELENPCSFFVYGVVLFFSYEPVQA
jgi:hypothetical protein